MTGPRVKIGKLRNRCEFQSQVRTQNQTTYAYNTTWETQFTTWGQIKVSGGLIYARGDAAEPATTHTIVVRYRTDIVRGMRVRSDGVNYTVNRILQTDPGAKTYLTLHVQQEETEV